MSAAANVTKIAEKTLNHMGFELVRVRLAGTHRPVLEVMIDRLDNAAVSMEDCVEVSRSLSHILDVHDPIPQSYVLEVTSPGLERPLTKPTHFAKVIGQTIKVELAETLEGQRKWVGVLQSATDDYAIIQSDALGEARILTVPLASVTKAKVVDVSAQSKPTLTKKA